MCRVPSGCRVRRKWVANDGNHVWWSFYKCLIDPPETMERSVSDANRCCQMTLAVIPPSWRETYTRTKEGFYVKLYQANFTSYHTRDRHVGFLFARDGIGKYNKMSHNFLFSSYHNTKLQLRDKNISTHNRLKFQILPWSESKVQAFFFSPYRAAQKGNQEMLQNRERILANRVVQTLCFHVTSYQANFATHPFRDCHVCFLLHGRV